MCGPISGIKTIGKFSGVFFTVMFRFPRFVTPLIGGDAFVPLRAFKGKCCGFFRVFRVEIGRWNTKVGRALYLTRVVVVILGFI